MDDALFDSRMLQSGGENGLEALQFAVSARFIALATWRWRTLFVRQKAAIGWWRTIMPPGSPDCADRSLNGSK